jgi:hypothetical protein
VLERSAVIYTKSQSSVDPSNDAAGRFKPLLTATGA